MQLSTFLSEPLNIGNVRLSNRVFLAPMSGITDRPFRERAYAHGAGLVVSEMVASGELAKRNDESNRRIQRTGDGPHMVQLAGRDAHWLAEGARIAAGEGADIIDINMGCPAKKVTGGYCGSALMREPDHALALIEAVVAAVAVPVTVKMRLGWDDETINAPHIARRAEEAGVRMVTVHGRTRCQFYTGRADWTAIAAVKQAVSIPVVANGDVCSAHDAAAILDRSGADAVMIGRGHYGAPWLAGEIAGGKRQAAAPASPADLCDYVVAHYEDMLAHYGVATGLRHARKHLGWYLDRHAPQTSDEFRAAIMTGTDPATVKRSLRLALSEAPLDEVEIAA
nr:tRNA dihydrouridine synthase DusB [Mesorhizobium sp.]